jgi:hypothetical protein
MDINHDRLATKAFWTSVAQEIGATAENVHSIMGGVAGTIGPAGLAQVRESFKGQLAAHFTKELASTQESGSVRRAGHDARMAMLDKLLDAFERPEVPMQAAQNDKLEADAKGEPNPTAKPMRSAGLPSAGAPGQVGGSHVEPGPGASRCAVRLRVLRLRQLEAHRSTRAHVI